jgi:hypothetical protein
VYHFFNQADGLSDCFTSSLNICIYWCRAISGAKYHKASDSVRVILRDGTIKHLDNSDSMQELSEEGQEMCQYVTEVSIIT